LFKFFKTKKTILFSEILEQMKDKFVNYNHGLYIHDENYGIIYEWEENRPFLIGDKLIVHEFYEKDNIHYRNTFTHIVG
jgi:hypothetical protein